MNGSDPGATLARAIELRRSLIGTTELTVVVPPPIDDGPPAAPINRAAQSACGALLVIVLPPAAGGPPEAIDLAETAVERLEDPAIGLWQSGSMLVLRTNLWLAVGGLEAGFETERWALADLRRKVTALAFRAVLDPHGRRPPVAPARASGVRDRELYRRRWTHTPRRVPPGRREPGPASPAVLYTAITRRYDSVKRQSAAASAGARQVAFLDDETRGANAPSGWELASLPASSRGPNRAAKYYKALPHRVFPEARYSLWIDASVLLVAPFGIQRLADLFLRDADLCLFRHPARDCAYDEARSCAERRLDDPATIAAQMSRYEQAGFPRDAGLVEAAVILRRHTRAIREFNELWWEEIERGSSRDQLSFPYVAWKLGVSYNRFPLFLSTENGLFLKTAREARS